jgi:thioesterase domain-containing protein
LGSAKEIAVECVQAILDPKSEGPDLVAGYSAPGTVALEIAQQLHVREAEVGLPALMGTYFPGYPRSIPGPLRQID